MSVRRYVRPSASNLEKQLLELHNGTPLFARRGLFLHFLTTKIKQPLAVDRAHVVDLCTQVTHHAVNALIE